MKKFLLLGAFFSSLLFGATSTYTTHYNLEKPSDGSTSWGAAIRDGLDTIDTQMFVSASSVAAHIADTTGAHAATAISATPGSSLCTSSINVQTFLECLDVNYGSVLLGGVAILNQNNIFSGNNTFNGTLTATGAVSVTAPATLSSTVNLSALSTGVVHANSLGLLSSSTLVDADISASAAITRSKIAVGTADHVVINSGTGALSSEAQLARTRGGTGVNSTATFPSSGVVVTEAASETLTNKTISGSSNTITNVSLTTGVTGVLPAANGGATGALTLDNCSLTASVGSNALTIALKDASGADASASSPCRVGVYNYTGVTGDYTLVSVTAALSTVISSGSTLGQISAQAGRVYVYAFNNAGTLALGISGYPYRDGNYSTTAEGGAGAADSLTVIYTPSALSTKNGRLIGSFDATEATAGTWATAPSGAQFGTVPDGMASAISGSKTVAQRIVQGTVVCSNAAPAITKQSGEIATVTGSGSTGLCSVNFTSGMFSDTPACVCNVINNNSQVNTGCYVRATSSSLTALTRYVNGSVEDGSVSVVCVGPR